MDTAYEFRITTQIVYGRNAGSRIGHIAAGTGVNKFVVITDTGVAGAGIIDCLMGPLKKAGIETVIFDGVVVNPTVQTVDRASGRFARSIRDHRRKLHDLLIVPAGNRSGYPKHLRGGHVTPLPRSPRKQPRGRRPVYPAGFRPPGPYRIVPHPCPPPEVQSP